MHSFQAEFQRTRGHLTDPHVRDLAWLLDSPDLLDSHASVWRGQIATLFDHQGPDIDAWLIELDHNPGALHAIINKHRFARLGRYAELLMAFFFQHRGILHAHGLQIRAGKNETVGEFDFLLLRKKDAHQADLLHWEFATKFYLLTPSGTGHATDYLVGPNLADTLGAKMRKILNRQLSLSHHPAAQPHLLQPVVSAQALIKGWLFYQGRDAEPILNLGVAPNHCRGFWIAMDEQDSLSGENYLILPRLKWLAPARALQSECINRQALWDSLRNHFASDTAPVMIAIMEVEGEMAVERERGFIVPNGWGNQAEVMVRNYFQA